MKRRHHRPDDNLWCYYLAECLHSLLATENVFNLMFRTEAIVVHERLMANLWEMKSLFRLFAERLFIHTQDSHSVKRAKFMWSSLFSAAATIQSWKALGSLYCESHVALHSEVCYWSQTRNERTSFPSTFEFMKFPKPDISANGDMVWKSHDAPRGSCCGSQVLFYRMRRLPTSFRKPEANWVSFWTCRQHDSIWDNWKSNFHLKSSFSVCFSDVPIFREVFSSFGSQLAFVQQKSSIILLRSSVPKKISSSEANKAHQTPNHVSWR